MIVLPLLPIFLIGLLPILLLSLLGPAGLIILGILVASAGLTDILDANGTFSEQIIVHGYAKGTERAGQRTALRSEMRFASVMIAAAPALRSPAWPVWRCRKQRAALVFNAPGTGPVINSSLAHPVKI